MGYVFVRFMGIMALSLLVVSGVSAESSAVTKELVDLQWKWNDAYNRHDRKTMEEILGDDYQFIDADGYMLNKKVYLDTMERVDVKSETVKEIEVRLFQDTAIVRTLWSGTYSFDSKEVTDTIRYTDVFVKRNGKWQAVSTQGTRLPKRKS